MRTGRIGLKRKDPDRTDRIGTDGSGRNGSERLDPDRMDLIGTDGIHECGLNGTIPRLYIYVQ